MLTILEIFTISEVNGDFPTSSTVLTALYNDNHILSICFYMLLLF